MASNALLKREHVIKIRRKNFCWKVKEDLENKLEFKCWRHMKKGNYPQTRLRQQNPETIREFLTCPDQHQQENEIKRG